MKFLIDTNMFLVPARYKIRLFEQLEDIASPDRAQFYTLSGVKKELEQLAAVKGKQGGYARLALTFLEKLPITLLPSTGPVDRALQETAAQGYVVCTVDKALLRKLRQASLPVITINRNQLIF